MSQNTESPRERASRVVRPIILVIGLIAVSTTSLRAQTTWTITDLGKLGRPDGHSEAFDINESGDVVGMSEPPDGGPFARPFLWTPTGGMVAVGTLTPSNPWGWATSINDRGQVVGLSTVPVDAADSHLHPFLWTATEGIRDLGTLGGACVVPTSINNLGHVVGWSTLSGICPSQAHAFLWTAEGGMRDLGTLGGPSSEANAINDAGQVVGSSETANGERHAFIWTAATGMVDLGTLSGLPTGAFAINNLGQVVGGTDSQWKWRSMGNGRAFRWTAAEGMRDLGTLGGNRSKALDVNDAGQIVGWSEIAPGGALHAFVWTEAGGMVDLGTLGWHESLAGAINEAGEIVGYSCYRPDPIHVFCHAVLWRETPTPPGMTGVTLTTEGHARPTLIGAPVTLRATGYGGSEAYEYQFWIAAWNGPWQMVRDYSEVPTYTWVPPMSGGYVLAVDARSRGSTTIESQAVINFVVYATPAGPMTGVSLTPEFVGTPVPGSLIRLHARGQGSTPPYGYRFWIQPWGGAWRVVREWSELPFCDWVPTLGGGYNVTVEARSGGAPEAEVHTTINFVVSQAP